MSEQPEALRLANLLMDGCEDPMWAAHFEISKATALKSAAELRRQHADIEQLKAQVFLQMKWKTDAQNENERLLEINAELLRALRLAQLIIGHPDDSHSRHIRAVIAKAEGRTP